MPSPIVVLGSTGQVGRALLKELGSRGVGLARPEADLTRVGELLPALQRLEPSALINASAYTDVERAESEEALAAQVNGHAPGALAEWAKNRGIPFVHYSTDYVFSGDGSRPWREQDVCGPISAYGRTKREGELAVEKAGGKFLILRTSWVYDATGKNFVNTMLRLAAERDSLNVVNDQIGAPTFAREIARATLGALHSAGAMSSFPSGIFHLTASGETSWFGFANEIFAEARSLGAKLKVSEVKGIPADAYPTRAKRPKNSRLDGAKFRETFGIAMRDWKSALNECLKEKFSHASS